MIQTSTRPEFRRKLRLLHKMAKRRPDPMQLADIMRRMGILRKNRKLEVSQ